MANAYKSLTSVKQMAKNGSFDLKEEILKLKNDFESKYSKNEVSGSSDALQSFKFMAILGQGAFGVVVSD